MNPEARLFLIALVLTCGIESSVFWFICRIWWRSAEIKTSTLVIAGILPSIVTLPYLWFVLPLMLPDQLVIPAGESLVIVVEALLLSGILRLGIRRSLIASLLCNIASYSLGLLI